LAFEEDSLKEQYDLELLVKEKLETKANNMTTIAGVTATLIFGFAQLFISKLADVNHYQNLNYVNGLLGTALVFSSSAVLLSVMAWRIQEYRYVVGTETVDRSSLVSFQPSALEQHKDKTTAYVTSIVKNAKNNNTKKELIEVSQWLFVITMLCITIFSIWLLIYPITFSS
jgi:hypothetical protein